MHYDYYGYDEFEPYGYEPYSGWRSRRRRNPRKKSLAKAARRKKKRGQQALTKQVPKRRASRKPASFAPKAHIVSEGVWRAPKKPAARTHHHTQLRLGLPFEVSIDREDPAFNFSATKYIDELFNSALSEDPEIREQLYQFLMENLYFNVDGEFADSVDIDLYSEQRGPFTLTVEIPRDVGPGGWKSYEEGRQDAFKQRSKSLRKQQQINDRLDALDRRYPIDSGGLIMPPQDYEGGFGVLGGGW